MTITSMVSLKGGKLLATGDRAEHIRVSQAGYKNEAFGGAYDFPYQLSVQGL